jgi:ubiquinone/menaquinone biosynthesis C-methylase UbiE
MRIQSDALSESLTVPAPVLTKDTGESLRLNEGESGLPSDIYTADYYLQVCGGYEEFLEGGVAARLEEAIRLGRLEPGMTVLDIGSGRGEMAVRCAEEGCRVWGIDYSADALSLSRGLILRKGRNKHEGRVAFQMMNSKSLAFPDGFFDRVFLIDVVEHQYPGELEATLKEVRRVTKVGGRVVVHTAPNAWLIKPIYLLAGVLFQWKRHPYHVNEQSYLGLRRNLRQLGGLASIKMSKVAGFFKLGVGPRSDPNSRFERMAQLLDAIFDARPVAALIASTPLKFMLATDLWATVDLPSGSPGGRPGG